MAILVIAKDPTGTPELASKFRELLDEKMKAAPGFIFHVDGPLESGGYQIVDAWESREAFEAWFENEVKPLLPDGGQAGGPPQIHELDNVVTR